MADAGRPVLGKRQDYPSPESPGGWGVQQSRWQPKEIIYHGVGLSSRAFRRLADFVKGHPSAPKGR
jgi:hypothetical protein